MAARYHSFLYIRMICLPCILAQLRTSWAYLTNLQASCVRLKDEVRSLYWHSVGPLAHVTFLNFNWSWNTSFESPGITGPLQLGFCELNSPTKHGQSRDINTVIVHIAHGSLADGITVILHTIQVCDIQTAASLFVSKLLAFETLHQIHSTQFHVVSCVHTDIKPEIWIKKCWSTFLMTWLEFRDKIIHESKLDYFLRASFHLLSLNYEMVSCGMVCGVVRCGVDWSA